MSTDKPKTKARNGKTAVVLFAVAGGMVGLAFASVPLYQLFCQVTGYGGAVSRVEAGQTPAVASQQPRRMITVRFDSNVNSGLPWRFKPEQKQITLPIGVEKLVRYRAENLSNETIVGTATFNVTPYKIGEYFSKVECFCFTEQTLAPGEQASLPVSFFVDPAILDDPLTRDIKTITLSYTFYRDPDDKARAENRKHVATDKTTETKS